MGSGPAVFSAESSASLLERLDQLNGRGESDSGDDEHGQKGRRCKLGVVCAPNELLADTADYPECKIVSRKGSYEDLSRHVLCSRKKIDVKGRPHALSRSDAVAVLGFLAQLKDACNPNCLAESIAV